MARREDDFLSLSCLIEALHQSVHEAQAGIDQEFRAVLHRLITVDERGEPQLMTWTCTLPGLDVERSLELPLASLMLCRKPVINCVDVSFEAEVEHRPLAASVALALPEKSPTLSGRAWSWLRGLFSRRPAIRDGATEVWFRFRTPSWWSRIRGKRVSKVRILLQCDQGNLSSEVTIGDAH